MGVDIELMIDILVLLVLNYPHDLVEGEVYVVYAADLSTRRRRV
jgi:hypothetical protein